MTAVAAWTWGGRFVNRPYGRIAALAGLGAPHKGGAGGALTRVVGRYSVAVGWRGVCGGVCGVVCEVRCGRRGSGDVAVV